MNQFLISCKPELAHGNSDNNNNEDDQNKGGDGDQGDANKNNEANNQLLWQFLVTCKPELARGSDSANKESGLVGMLGAFAPHRYGGKMFFFPKPLHIQDAL